MQFGGEEVMKDAGGRSHRIAIELNIYTLTFAG
jgi:hypothetical protein